MKNKICFFMATPFTLGGEQRVVTILSNMLVDCNYDVTILCTDDKTHIDYSIYGLNKQVKIKFVNGYNSKKLSKIRKKRLRMELKCIIKGKYKNSLRKQKFIHCDKYTSKLLINELNNKYDYVISLSTDYNCMLSVISDKINAKTIGWQHGCCKRYFETLGIRHYNQEKFTRYMFEKLDSYVVLTKKDQEYIKNMFNFKSVVINNPKSLKSNKVSSLNQKTFLSVGRLVDVKNFETLINMFYKFHKVNKDWKLIIVGDGPLRDKLIDLVKRLKLTKFVTIEKFTKNISEYYEKSSCYLMPSLIEGWPMVLCEAMEFGLPIISFGINAAYEIIKNDYNGYVIEDYNEDDFVNAMLSVAANFNKLTKLGKNSKKTANEYSNEKICNKWIDLFNNLN